MPWISKLYRYKIKYSYYITVRCHCHGNSIHHFLCLSHFKRRTTLGILTQFVYNKIDFRETGRMTNCRNTSLLPEKALECTYYVLFTLAIDVKQEHV